MNGLLKSWANSFLYRSVGDKYSEISSDIDEESLQLQYKINCEEPITKLMNLSEDTEFTGDVVKAFISEVNSTPLTNCMHIIKDLTVYNKPLQDAIGQFLSTHVEVYATCDGVNTFVTYINKKGEIVGSYPEEIGMTTPICIGLKSNFKIPLDLQTIKKRSPVTLNDYSVQALRILNEAGMLRVDELRSARFPMLRNGKCAIEDITAVTDGLPSYFVRNLINTLPPAYSEEFDNIYVAALNWAKEHPYEHGREIEELERIVKYVPKNQPKKLTDDEVISYIHEKYGISVDSIRSQLLVPTSEKLYTSSYLLRGEDKNMTAEEFIDLVNENPMAASGTLDEIIEGFCDEEGFSKDCTVQNLIDYINDVPFKNQSIQQLLLADVEEKHIDTMTPIEYYLSGKEYTEQSAKAIALDVINRCGSISGGMRASIKRAMLNNEQLDVFNILEELDKLGLPEDVYEALSDVIVNNAEFKLPRPAVTESEVIQYLVSVGIPRSTAIDLLSKGLDEIMKDDFKYYGYSDTFYERLKAGDVIEELDDTQVLDYLRLHNVDARILECIENKHPWDEKATVSAYLTRLGLTSESLSELIESRTSMREGDLAYKVAESLLYDVRQFLSEGDTEQRRQECDPIWYSFLCVAVMENTDASISEVRKFLEDKKDNSSPAMVEIIDKALALMGGVNNEK